MEKKTALKRGGGGFEHSAFASENSFRRAIHYTIKRRKTHPTTHTYTRCCCYSSIELRNLYNYQEKEDEVIREDVNNKKRKKYKEVRTMYVRGKGLL